MPRTMPGPLAAWTALAVAAALATGWYVHAARTDARLLRADPDLIPATPDLMEYAVARGRRVYGSNCLGCHGARGAGDPSRGIPVLADDDWLYGTGLVSDIERTITYGIRSNNPKGWNLALMPAFGRAHPSPSNPALPPLSPRQIADVVEFLRAGQHRAADADAVTRGAAVYQGVGGCYDCHSPDAQGDGAIGAPNLTDNVTLYGDGERAALYDSIANGRQGVCPAWLGVLTPASIREVALYLYRLGQPAEPGKPMPP